MVPIVRIVGTQHSHWRTGPQRFRASDAGRSMPCACAAVDRHMQSTTVEMIARILLHDCSFALVTVKLVEIPSHERSSAARAISSPRQSGSHPLMTCVPRGMQPAWCRSASSLTQRSFTTRDGEAIPRRRAPDLRGPVAGRRVVSREGAGDRLKDTTVEPSSLTAAMSVLCRPGRSRRLTETVLPAGSLAGRSRGGCCRPGAAAARRFRRAGTIQVAIVDDHYAVSASARS